jgi:hypothetical protein
VQALQQMHKVLGQVDVLGTPIVLGSSLLSGISSLIIEPTKAHSPEEFLFGVFSGTFTLLRNTAFGFINAFGQVGLEQLRSILFVKLIVAAYLDKQ